MMRGVIAIAAAALPHGHAPNFGVGYFAGSMADYPYAHNFESLHKWYSFAFVGLTCALLLASDVRVLESHPEWRVPATMTAGVVSVLLVALQMQGTYLAYSTWRTSDPITGPGIWLGGALALYASVERA